MCSPHVSHVILLRLRGLDGRLLWPLAVLLGLLSEQHVPLYSLLPLALSVSLMARLSCLVILARPHLGAMVTSGVSSSQRQPCCLRSLHWPHAALLPASSAVPAILPVRAGHRWLSLRLQSLLRWLRGHPSACLSSRLGPGR